jgi:RNase P/RNase MRP subunit p29
MEIIMNKRLAMFLGVALLGLMVRTAWAHEGHIHTIMGTVMERDAHSLQVKTPSGEVLSIAITDKTTVVRGKQKAAIADVQKGARVVVGIGNGEDPLIAGEIRLGAAPAAAKK